MGTMGKRSLAFLIFLSVIHATPIPPPPRVGGRIIPPLTGTPPIPVAPLEALPAEPEEEPAEETPPPPSSEPVTPPPPPASPPLAPSSPPQEEPVTPTPAASTTLPFKTGQAGALMLSGAGFNQSGGALLFNHNSVPASDGTRLAVADRFNNRVLIWTSIPSGNTPPDLVLGQSSMASNDPGTGRDQMNWPVSVAMAAGKLVVSDTNNHRLLIWTRFPTTNGQAADLVIDGSEMPKERQFEWNWGVWTDGVKLVATGVGGVAVSIWNTFPTQDHQLADIALQSAAMGTPRTVAANGQYLVVGDHNAKQNGEDVGQRAFVWTSWPSANTDEPDFMMAAPDDANFAWLSGTITADNQLVMLARNLYIWNTLPTSATERPDLTVTGNGTEGFSFDGGDGSGCTMAGNRLVVSMANGNRLVVYNRLPTKTAQAPDYALGASDITTNTLLTHHIITNPAPATDGESLFVISDLERSLSVWSALPTESGVDPDYTASLPLAPPSIVVAGERLVIAGEGQLLVWDTLPRTAPRDPDRVISGTHGDVALTDSHPLLAWDGTYFFLGQDEGISVWRDFPGAEQTPAFTLSLPEDASLPWQMSSNGRYLVIPSLYEQRVLVYDLMAPNTPPQAISGTPQPHFRFNLPQAALLTPDNALFVADTSFNRVLVWDTLDDALLGNAPNVVLGEADLLDTVPEIGASKLFMPAYLALDTDGSLWVGEFKFSNRIIKFAPQVDDVF